MHAENGESGTADSISTQNPESHGSDTCTNQHKSVDKILHLHHFPSCPALTAGPCFFNLRTLDEARTPLLRCHSEL